VKPLASVEVRRLNVAQYPAADESKKTFRAEARCRVAKGVIEGIRNIRAEMKYRLLKAPVENCFWCRNGSSRQDKARLDANLTFLQTLAKLDTCNLAGSRKIRAYVGNSMVAYGSIVPMRVWLIKNAWAGSLGKKEIDKKTVQRTTTHTGKLSLIQCVVAKAPAESGRKRTC